MPARAYVELHAKSAFSFLEGASTPEQLAAECARYGQHAIAVADVNGVYGSPRLHYTSIHDKFLSREKDSPGALGGARR